jgi:hypothetical protein
MLHDFHYAKYIIFTLIIFTFYKTLIIELRFCFIGYAQILTYVIFLVSGPERFLDLSLAPLVSIYTCAVASL